MPCDYLRFLGWLVAVTWLVCPGCDRKSQTTSRETSSAPQPDAAKMVATDAPDGISETDNPANSETDNPANSATESSPLLWGRWKGRRTCLDLFANGDFELSVLGRRHKVVVLGRTTQSAGDTDVIELELSVSGIWAARWTSPCRKSDRLGEWRDAQYALGAMFYPDEKTRLRLRRLAEGSIELCGERCETMATDKPLLGGKWFRPHAPGESVRVEAGELRHLDIQIHRDEGRRSGGIGYVVSADEKYHPTAAGTATVTHQQADTFLLTFVPHRRSFVTRPPDESRTVLGVQLRPETPAELRLRRLRDQHLEVCGGSGQCTTLQRRMDANSHDLR